MLVTKKVKKKKENDKSIRIYLKTFLSYPGTWGQGAF